MGLLSFASQSRSDAAEDISLKEAIAEYQEQFSEFNCIVFQSSGSEKQFCQKIGGMLNNLGMVLPLSIEHQLVILPPTLDQELLTHRISKSLDTAVLASFEANSHEKVLAHIKSIL